MKPRDERAALFAALGGDDPVFAPVVADLEALIQHYREAARQDLEHARRHRYKSAPPSDTAKAARRIARAAAGLQKALAAAPEMLRQRLRVNAGTPVAFEGAPPCAVEQLTVALPAVQTAARELAVPAPLGPMTSRGRKSEPLRTLLDVGVVAVLERHGLQTKVYAGGVAGRVVKAVQELAVGVSLGDPRGRLRAALRAKR